MISDSVPLMTAIDLLIVAVTVYGIWRCRLINPGKRFERPRIGLLLINSGLLAVALFYAADLAIMHVLPMVTVRDEAMKAMEALHRNLSWLLILFAVISISIGFIELLVELQRRQARVRRLVDANIIRIINPDIEGQIIEANDAFLHMVGYDREDLVSGRVHMTDLTPTEWRARDARTVAELKATGTVQPFEKEYFRKDGSRVPVLIGSAAFDEQRDQGVAFVLDLTERKRAEAEARESEQRYREVQTELAHANRVATVGQLTASIAHEVKQPIGAAVAYAEAALRFLARRPPELEEVRESLEGIVATSYRAGEVIDRIRTLIKKAPPRNERLDINDAILEVVALTRHEAVKNRVSVETQLTEGLPPVQGDRVQLRQVVLNLIINAVEAMSGSDEGTRQLLINTDKADQKEIRIVVQDSGPGIAPESIDRVFHPFYTTKSSGLGIGLSICRSIIEAHEGRLWATAAEPRGAVFAFTLPVRPDNPL